MQDLSLRFTDSLVVQAQCLWHRLSCPAACGILVPWPGIEPTSPALQSRFLTTGPPGKSPLVGFFFSFGYILPPHLKTSAFSDYWERIHGDCDESRDEVAHPGLQLEIVWVAREPQDLGAPPHFLSWEHFDISRREPNSARTILTCSFLALV